MATEMNGFPSKFEVFFDGKCSLCRREIAMIRRKDKQNRLLLTDIADENFKPTDDISLDTLMREIHGRMPDGTYVTGVEVFREIYQRIGFGFFVKPSRLPLVRNLLDVAYRVFARIRYATAKHRLSKQSLSCETGSCSTKQLPLEECEPTDSPLRPRSTTNS